MNQVHYREQHVRAAGAIGILKQRFEDKETGLVTWSIEWMEGPEKKLVGRIRESDITQVFPTARPTADIGKSLLILLAILTTIALIIAIATWIGVAFYYSLPHP